MKLQINNWCTLPTPIGKFRMYDSLDENYSVICMGDISNQGEWPLFRVHSSCRASEVFGALDCDCADQLTETMKNIAAEGRGIVVYQQQEGRGHGLSVKINAVRMMEDKQVDTAEAFEQLGIEQDIRSYAEAVSILKQLDIEKVRLVSNNPRKRQFLNNHGIQTSVVHTNPNIRPENKEYLHTKNEKLGHNLPLASESNDGQPIHFYHSDQPWGELSNFSRHSVFLDGKIWPTTEHYYQAQKFESQQLKEQIRCAATPILAKSKAHQHLEEYGRADWIDVREHFMLEALRAKFKQHPNLAEKLLSSGNRLLVELTANDEYWGDPGNGSGQNRLGQLLMQVRTELKGRSIVSLPLAEAN